MTNNPDLIRADIERTRTELGRDVDALADKVSPSKAVGRQTDKVKAAAGRVKDRVMGSAHDVRDSAAGSGHAVADKGHQAVEAAKGNPLAVGLIAFGVGWLASSLVPASEKEKELGAQAKETVQPLVQDAVQEMGEHMKEPARDAAESVKEAAGSAADTVKNG